MVLVLLWGCAVSGCAVFACKPPTPAAQLSPRQSAAIVASPGQRYFILVFGSQSTPVLPRYTHSWATVVKVTDCGQPGAPCVEEQTISWMPVSLDIKPWSLRVEPGCNLGLHFTIEEMLRQKERISLWGPYEVTRGFAYRFQVQKAFMESGQVGYQCIDSAGEAARTGDGCDCIHAITDMDPVLDRERYPLLFFGELASLNFVRQMHRRPIIICPDADHGWLLPLLGLDRYPIQRRTYFGPNVPRTPENVERCLRRYDPHGENRCGGKAGSSSAWSRQA
jgi:hypothetical protein